MIHWTQTLLLFSLMKVLGACWYLLSIERQEACWKSVCKMEESSCKYDFFDCNMVKDSVRASWFITSNVTNLCSPNGHFYQFGIYGDAVTSKVTTSAFFNKYFFCLWWGLRNLRYVLLGFSYVLVVLPLFLGLINRKLIY
jgi:cyclic nucleotide gated channel